MIATKEGETTFLCLVLAGGTIAVAQTGSKNIVHDAEYYILEVQNGKKWAVEDGVLDNKHFGNRPGTVGLLFR